MKARNISAVSAEELAAARGKSANLAEFPQKTATNLDNSSNFNTNILQQKKPSLNNKYIKILISKYESDLQKFFEPYGLKKIVELKNDNGELIELVAICDHFDAHFNDFEVYLNYDVNERYLSGNGNQMNDLLNFSDDTGTAFERNLANLLWLKVFGNKFSSSYPEDKQRYDLKRLDETIASCLNIPLADRQTLADLERNKISGLYNLKTYGNANIEEYIERKVNN